MQTIISHLITIVTLAGASSFLNIPVFHGSYAAAADEQEVKIQWPGLFDVQSIGTLREFSLVSAKPCKDCAHERALFLLPPKALTAARYTLFVYPGKVTDPKNQQVVLESRAFYGRCLKTSDEGVYVVFQKERVDRRNGPQPSVFIATPSLTNGSPLVEEKLLEGTGKRTQQRLPDLNYTLKRVKEKQCFEIPGRNRLALKKPLDVPPPPGSSDDSNDSNDEDDGLKGNQNTLKTET